VNEYPIVIGGKSIQTTDHFEVRNPATGEVVGLAPKASRSQLDDAVEAANVVFPNWSKLPDKERKNVCRAVAKKIGDHAEELARLLTMEQGKPLNGLGSRFELGGTQAWAQYTAELDIPVKILQDNNEGRVELHRKPMGVVGSITPWNFPLMIAIWHIIPAIRTGNTVVNKPSPDQAFTLLLVLDRPQLKR
jgi:acyl-CoA reductase-like NAD-dependent aldehyde dehydrogenase